MAVNVAELEKDRYRAMREADLATLDALLGEGYTMAYCLTGTSLREVTMALRAAASGIADALTSIEV